MSYNSETFSINYVSKYIGFTFYSEVREEFKVFWCIKKYRYLEISQL